jgi:WhiB family transcriptional regulator, redox-sensing transcriptional regulator
MTTVLMPLPERHAQDHWMKFARCQDHPEPNLWFPEQGSVLAAAKAKAVCRVCPVRVPCLVWAVKHEGRGAHRSQRYGIWGGTTAAERHGIVRKLRNVEMAAWAPVLVGMFAELDADFERQRVESLARKTRIESTREWNGPPWAPLDKTGDDA